MRRPLFLFLTLALTAFSVLAQQPSAPTLPPGDGAAAQATPAESIPGADLPAAPIPARTCPEQTQGAFNAARLICEGLQDGQVCLGNGIVTAAPRPNASDVKLGQPADRAPLVNLQSLGLNTLTSENGLYTVVAARPELLTTSGQVVAATMILFGDATLTDDGDVVQEVSGQRSGTVIADFGLNIRRAPDPASQTIWQLRSGDTVTLTGRLADRTWLRVIVPNGFGTTGWVYAPYMDVSGDFDTIVIVAAGEAGPTPVPQQAIEFRTMQAFNFSSTPTDASCAETPDGGMLLQSPNGVASRVRTRINNVEIEFNGTLLIQAQADGEFQAHVLEGQARFMANDFPSETVPGQVVKLKLNAALEATSAPVPEPSSAASLRSLPLALLPRPIALAGDIVPETVPTETVATTTDVTPAIVATIEGQPALPTPAVPAEVVTPLPPVVTGSLTYPATGELCGAAPAVLTQPAVQGTITQLDGIFRVTAGTSVTFEVSGGTFQPTFGNYIRLNSVTGIVAQSADQPTLTYVFPTDATFSASFSSRSGETLTVTVRCG